MLNEKLKKTLKQQQYIIIGKNEHSAVKICGWTKNALRGKGSCYKCKFYGIQSSQCLQMTTALACANKCIFCWREDSSPVCKKWNGKIDNPKEILNESLKAQHKLLTGYYGYVEGNQKEISKSKKVKHVALSLIGEPILYPKINELIDLFHKNKISTFLVTNAQYPEQIKKLKPVTQLYLSLDAPNKELLKKIDRPIFKDYWQRLIKSLKIMAKRKDRTCIRLTMIKDVNMINPSEYAKLIMIAKPDFIELKAYMHVGKSRKNLKRENMSLHPEIVKFSKELVKYLPNYEIVDEHIPSKVVLLAKKKFKGNTKIDFGRFFEILNSGKEPKTEDYFRKTPKSLVID